ncbi:YbaN family protein [Anaerovorax odorimutans]|uniref:YbaN family protein n=1 Tax=Anaerovorax odorimutans TaxID=109327 RepID=UPI00041576F4|nr:YbaN family protein [Anaerovorax odorimutans]
MENKTTDFENKKKNCNKIALEPKKIILIILGSFFLILGSIGIFLPLLPTTPFVLLASICYGSSSPKLYDKLRSSKYFGPFIENYKSKSGIPKNVKVKAISFLWITLLISAILSKKLFIHLILLIVGISVTIHICLLKTKK